MLQNKEYSSSFEYWLVYHLYYWFLALVTTLHVPVELSCFGREITWELLWKYSYVNTCCWIVVVSKQISNMCLEALHSLIKYALFSHTSILCIQTLMSVINLWPWLLDDLEFDLLIEPKDKYWQKTDSRALNGDYQALNK